MTDWLSDVERRQEQEAAKQRRLSEQMEREHQQRSAYARKSYEVNKDRIDQIYCDIEAYAKRAAEMGYKVTLQRTGECFSIIQDNPSPKGYTWIYIVPDGNKLKVTFMNYGYTERRVPLRRVSEGLIGEWIKWVIDRGLKGKPPR